MENTKNEKQYAIHDVSHGADLKDKFLKKVEQIAQKYHDRLCMSGLTMEGQVCKCCESVVLTTTSIEHDSQDYSKDLNVCSNCYSHIVTWWKNNKPRKIAPI
jgi:RNase P subunit RPR2